jgi:hypothetical protein
MRPRCISLLLLLCACASAQKTSPPAHLSKETRLDLIHVFNAEIVYIRAQFPMGKKGLAIKDGVVSPSGEELQKLLALWGPAIKPGDEARITNVVVKSNSIHFEINGGPVKKQKWYQHVSVGVGGGSVPVSPSDQNANPRGTYVDLLFDHYVPELTPQQVKDLVRPVFDFDAKSAVEAYLDTVPPKVKEAIQNHKVLVGMNREMVTYSKGRPPRKIREKDGDTEYEDWIYGEPPQDVEFVRMVGDEVVRVETMKVDGTKTLRTEKEVTLETQPSVAKADQAKPAHAPSLRRPGEAEPDRPAPSGTQTPVLTPPVGSDPPPTGPPNYSI